MVPGAVAVLLNMAYETRKSFTGRDWDFGWAPEHDTAVADARRTAESFMYALDDWDIIYKHQISAKVGKYKKWQPGAAGRGGDVASGAAADARRGVHAEWRRKAGCFVGSQALIAS